MSLDLKAEKISQYIWDWMNVTYDIPHGNAQETGITSYLMYELYRENSALRASSSILKFKKVGAKEAISGADFFMIIEINNVIYNLLVQAKRLSGAKTRPYIENTYSSFKHTVFHVNKDLYQYFLLLRYIKSTKCPKGAIPYYLFYNSSFEQPDLLTSLLKNDFSGKVNFLKDVDRKYSYSSNNKEVFGTLLTNAYEFLNLFGHFPISPDIKNLTNPTLKQVLQLDSTVTLQEFLRRASAQSSNGRKTNVSGRNGEYNDTKNGEDFSGEKSKKEAGSDNYSVNVQNINGVNIKESVLKNINYKITNKLNKDSLNEHSEELRISEKEDRYIRIKNRDFPKYLDFRKIITEHEIKFQDKDPSDTPKIEDLTDSSLKELKNLQDRPKLKKKVENVINNNHDRLPIFIVSLN